MSTKEQIEEAKIDIKNVVRLSLGVVPLDDALALLDALEAAESRIKELEAAGNKVRPHCILREACDEWDALIDSTNR